MDQKEHGPEFDFSQVTEQIFLGTNLCCKEKSHVQLLLDIGITGEIDLEEERQETPPKVDAYLWIPVPDKNPPSQDQFDIAVVAMEKMIQRGKKIYVHCRWGHGRSPTIVAAYLIFTGLGVDEAINKIKEARPEIHLEEVQKQALIEYEKRIRQS